MTIMKESSLRKPWNTLSLLAAAFVFAGPAYGMTSMAMPSGGDYQITSSQVDNGGGAKLGGGGYSVRGSMGQTMLPNNLGTSTGGDYVNRTGFNNPPHLTYQGRLDSTLAMGAGEVRLTLPSNSVGKELFDITLNKDPVVNPLLIDPNRITDANEKIVHNDGAWSQLYANNISEMAIFDEQSYYTSALAKPGVMTIHYQDVDDDGIMDNTFPPVRVNSLSAWVLDQDVNSWVQMPLAGADTASKTLTVYFGMPGVYALLGTQDLAVNNVKAYPVPFRPGGPLSGKGIGQTGTEAEGITFDNLPQSGNIFIYTLDGRQVKKISIPENLMIQKLTWDVKTSSGEKVASGVYIWRIVAGKNSKTGKLMVIR